MTRSLRSINSEFMREVASELDDQRAAIARCVELFDESKKANDRSLELFEEAKTQLIKIGAAQGRTHQLLIDEADKLGAAIRTVAGRVAHVERMTGVTPPPAE